ncbi:aminotransferase class I/II-fold pyridoxal phosphate-dependent enzyme [Sulfurimonas paralvinellae]|uniref:Aminotransferase class I/II-fold pyridoxal phosphate-dependent enzyme n=2 Tax=Sulfurimonas paralvinellae TaxID=317658 RepID=A0A7M1BAC8_9BACT|nr:aminotransferase class I/II-fold pyridoxal phosphate-dependent enzyme [Sulfurimonas paralvinellae]
MHHGGNIYKYAKELDCKPDEIIDFSSNINCYAPETLIECSSSLVTKYADSNYPELKQTIAANYKTASQNIALYNGATAAIYALLSSLKSKKVTLYAPLYGEYEKAALAAKKNIYKINRIENIDAKVEKKSIVIFVNPATPEGSFYDIEELFLMWKKKKCTIIVDESFIEFENHKSLKNQIDDYKKLYIIQSFTKFYACAGVRIGAVFSHKKNIRSLNTPLWNISSLDAAFLQKRLNDEDFKNKARATHLKQKEELQRLLKESRLFDTIVASEANFILTQSSHASEIFEHLLAHKILVRSCESFDFLDNSWLRFAVKDETAHTKLKEALSAFA